MCESATIEVLSLNGLGAAEGCKNTVKFPFSGVSIFNTIGGTVPECVWHLRNLTVLHLTGNGLTGEIISDLPLYSSIIDLSLSHNQLSGTVSSGFQMIPTLDLSYNQFSGTYVDSAQVWAKSSVNFEINRLSGRLPVSKLANVSSLNILRGNRFSCDTIPGNDEYVDDYICGSEDLNDSLYLFGATLLLICCVMIVAGLCVATSLCGGTKEMVASSCIHRRITQLSEYFWYTDKLKQIGTKNLTLLKIVALSEKFKSIVWIFVQLSALMLLVISPIYIIKSGDSNSLYSTHSNTYSWFWTLAYMHGVVPSSLLMVSWVVMISVCFYHMILAPSVETSDSRSQEDSSSRQCIADNKQNNNNNQRWWTIFVMSVVVVANASITIVVNALYIYSTEQPLSEYMHFGVQFSLAVFRLAYAYCVFPFLSRPIVDPIANINFRLRLLTVNNLIIPCFATMFTSPACFQVCSLCAYSYSFIS